MGVVKGVKVVVRPPHRLAAQLLLHVLRELGTEAQMVDYVGERVATLHGCVPVVLEVVDVHIAVAEAPARGDVEVSDDLVHAQATLDATAFVPLLLQLLGVVLAFALLDTFTLSEGPRCLRVRLSNLVASLAAPGLLRIRWGVCAVARPAVCGVQMCRALVGRMTSNENRSGPSTIAVRISGATYRLNVLESMGAPPSLWGRSLVFFTPCWTPCCCSPETSMTSSVRSSQGTRGKLMLRWISIRSPVVVRAQGYSSAKKKTTSICAPRPLYLFIMKHEGGEARRAARKQGCRTSALINHQLRVYQHLPVFRPFPPREEQHHDQRDDSDNAAGRCPDPRILDRLGEGIEPRESRFRRHVCRPKTLPTLAATPQEAPDRPGGVFAIRVVCRRLLLGQDSGIRGKRRGGGSSIDYQV